MASTFIPLHRRCVVIRSEVNEVGDCLDLSAAQEARLCNDLSALDSYTRLIADLPGGTVQVGIECNDGQIKVTEILPAGATVPGTTELFFDWTAENWADLQCAGEELIDDDTDGDGDSGDDDDDSDEGSDPCTWESCGYLYTHKDGKVTKEPIANNPNVEGSVFDPARVTITDGKPVFSEATCAPVQNAHCDPCLTKQTGN
jgi:hypothetical protein